MNKNLYLKRTLSIFLTVILVLSSLSVGASALTVGNQYTISQASTEYKYIKYWGEDGTVMSPSERGWETFYKRTIASTGEPAYCLEFGKDFMSGTNTTAQKLTDTAAWKEATPAAQYGVTLASIYGYPHTFAGFGDAAYLATQVIMWEYMLGYRTDASATDPTYGITGGYDENNKCARFLLGMQSKNYTDVYTAYCGILAEIANHTVKPNLNNDSLNLQLQYDPTIGKYTGTFNDTNGILSKYLIEFATGDVSVSKNGNSLTITSDKPIPSNDVAKLRLVKEFTNYNNGVALFASDELQSLLYGTLKDPQTIIFNVYTGVGKIVIQKNSEDGKVSGVQFNVTNETLGYNETFETNASGKIEITDLVCGYEYTIREITDDKYVELPPATVTATEGGTFVTFNNHLKKGSITVSKTDAVNNSPLAGAMFVIFEGNDVDWSRLYVDENGEDTFLTDENGKLFINNIPAGDYTLFEASSPEGYQQNDTLYHFTIVDGNTNLSFDIKNEREMGTLRIVKTDANDTTKVLEGAELKIVAAEDIAGTEHKAGDVVAENIKTLSDGTAQVLLEPGKYNVYETKAPNGYYCNPEKAYPVTVSASGAVVDLTIKNEKISVELKKVSDKGTALRGAKISVYEADASFNITNDTPIFTGETTASEMVLEGLNLGHYVIKETEAPFKYALPKDNHIANMTIAESNDKNSYTVSFTNLSKGSYPEGNTLYAVNYPVSVVIHKIDKDTKLPISGAGFEVFMNSSNSFSAKTNDNGDAVFEGLVANATYTYFEYETPDGYYSDVDGRGEPVKKTFKTDDYGNIIVDGASVTQLNLVTGYPEIVVENEKTEFTILKTDANTGKALAGATFALYSSNGTFLEEKNTDANGKIVLVGYPEGSYYAMETKAPNGYAVDKTTKQFFVIGKNSPNTLTVENQPLEISLHKVDAQTNLSLQDAEYHLYVLNGSQYKRADDKVYKTDSDGVFTIRGGFEVGKQYYLVEVKSPDGYYTEPTPLYFEFAEDGQSFVSVSSGEIIPDNTIEAKDIRTYFTIVKRDFETNEPISGVTFEIRDEKGTVIRTDETNANGEIKLYGLSEGKYYAYETVFPDGYIHNAAPIVFTIGLTDEKESTITNEQTKVVLKKTDEANGKSIEGALFDLYKLEGKTYVKVNENALKTDERGEISISKLAVNVPYYFIETQPVNGYYSNPTKINFMVNANGETCNLDGEVIGVISVQNTKTVFNILKIDADTNAPIANVTFSIYAKNGTENGQLVEVVTTDENGLATIYGLPEGSYYAVETVFPVGYIQNGDTRYDFEINAGTKDGVLNISNTKTSVTLSKIDLVNGEPVEGAAIEIYNADHETVYAGITDAAGTITVDYLPIGSYTYRETINPDGYQLNTYEYEFTINADGTISNGDAITNAPTEVVITKTDEDGNALEGAVIGVYDSQGDEVCRETTDENGQIVVRYLTSGEYTYKELVAPDGYKLNKEVYHFTINRDGSVVGDNVMVNETTSVTITKTDEDDVPLAGATIAVFDSEGNEVFRDVTNEFGKISIRGLYAGVYTYREIECPDGYVLDKNTYTFTIDAEGNVDGDNVIVNAQTSVEITKTDENGNPISGATIGIYDENDELLVSLVTDENGKVTVNGLLSGKYYFKEILPANGYEINTERYDFEITREGLVVGKNTLVNKLSTVIINKTDSEGKPLAGAVIDVFNENNELVYEGTTDENGQIVIRGLAQGKYYAVEKKAPNGYLLNDEKIEFVVNELGLVQGDIIITNTLAPVEVEMPKTGSSAPRNFVSGALLAAGLALTVLYVSRNSKKRENREVSVAD